MATTYDWGTTETQKRKHLLQKSTSPLGTVTGYLYDAYGNTIEVKKKESESGTAKYIKETTTYNADGTYAVTQTDARGKTVTTVTDPDKGTVSSVEDPNHQTISYTYDSQRRKTKTSTTLNGKEVRTEYGYGAQTGYLSEVKHNTRTETSGDVIYRFGYDGLGRQITTQVGSRTLSTTDYDPVTRQISRVTYGNGDEERHTYDSFGRLIGTGFDEEDTDRFRYTYDATGRVGAVEDTEQGTKTYAGYDLTGRPAKKTKLHGTDHVYTGEIKYNRYDLSGTFTEQVGAGREKHKTTFAYDDENRVNCLTYDGNNGKVEYTYDQLGRITQKKVTLNGHDQITSYTYTAGSGANASVIVFTVLETAKANGLNPEAYLNHLLSVLPERFAADPQASVDDLMPWDEEMRKDLGASGAEH